MRSKVAASNPDAGLAGLRILIVEDTGLIVQGLVRLLEDLECRVAACAARLDEAIAEAESRELDGVLLDLNLAGQESYPVADLLEKRGIPFIFISGYESGHLSEQYASAAHLQKPISRTALSTMMTRVFLDRDAPTT